MLAGAGWSAHADSARKVEDFTVRVDQVATPTGGTSLTWDARKGRWGMTVNVEAPKTREPDWTDVRAGAYFRVSPSLQIGGAVSMGDGEGQPEAWRKIVPQPPAPRVRLETAFKF
ncbi:MAG: NtrZ family periplasmic regulatory protein [Phenylobacterium sp.]